jgi:hypothetical protein
MSGIVVRLAWLADALVVMTNTSACLATCDALALVGRIAWPSCTRSPDVFSVEEIHCSHAAGLLAAQYGFEALDCGSRLGTNCGQHSVACCVLLDAATESEVYLAFNNMTRLSEPTPSASSIDRQWSSLLGHATVPTPQPMAN